MVLALICDLTATGNSSQLSAVHHLNRALDMRLLGGLEKSFGERDWVFGWRNYANE